MPNACFPVAQGYSDAAAKTACNSAGQDLGFRLEPFSFVENFRVDRVVVLLSVLSSRGRREVNMDLDPVLLSRLQFAWVIGWHILLPAFTIGMASYIAILEGMHLVPGRRVYLRISMYWIRIFSVAFGVGVVTGVVMPFQIGSNWSRYADVAGNVLGPLFAYEALTAFFLEAAFLGVLLFGRKLVPPWAHFVAALMIATGTLFSSFW